MTRRLLIIAMLLTSCGTTPEPVASEPSRAENPPTARSEDQPSPEANEDPEPKPYAIDPNGFGHACLADAECGWDDPCVPTRCIGSAHVPTNLKCGESMPAPGTCSCVENRCSLRPREAPAEAPSCRADSCGLDQSAGRCVAGSMLEANRYKRDRGPACHCDQETLECRFVWVEPIACNDADACWVSEQPPYHPVARPESLRGRQFRPCSDGEVAPVCRDGFCSLTAFKC